MGKEFGDRRPASFAYILGATVVPRGWSPRCFSLSRVNLDIHFAKKCYVQMPYAPLDQEFLLWSQQVFVGARVAMGASAVSLLARAQREWKSLRAAAPGSFHKVPRQQGEVADRGDQAFSITGRAQNSRIS